MDLCDEAAAAAASTIIDKVGTKEIYALLFLVFIFAFSHRPAVKL